MAAQPTRRRFTVDEYYRMGEAGILNEDDRVELIKGEIIQMPPIGSPHAAHVLRLTRLFTRALLDEAHVAVQNPLRLSDRSEPVPDLMLLRPRVDFYADAHPTARDVFLAVEVSDSTLRYDERTKVPLYARHGVPEVWIVDLNHELIQVHCDPTPSGYRLIATRRRGESLAAAAFPDRTFAVNDILG